MNRILLPFSLCIFLLSSEKGYSQLDVTSISIDASSFMVQNNCSSLDESGITENSSDTIQIGYSSFVGTGLVGNDELISADYSYIDNNDYMHHMLLNIELDVINRKMVSLHNEDFEGHSTFMGSEAYWLEEGNGINVSDVSYHISQTKDSLLVNLNATDLQSTTFYFGKYKKRKASSQYRKL